MYSRDFFPDGTFSSRRKRLTKILDTRCLDAIWLHQSRDLYYFSGTAQDGHLIQTRDGSDHLFIRKYTPRAVKDSDITSVTSFHRLSEIQSILRALVKVSRGAHRIGICTDVMSVKLWQRLQRVFPDAEWVDISGDIRRLRAVKSDEEIAVVHRAANLLDMVFDRITEWLKPGVTELELAARIEFELRREGHQGTLPVRALNSSIHYGNVLFGDSGAIRGAFDGPTCGPGLYPAIPKGAGWKPLKMGEPVFVDLVAGVGGYLADATRVYCLGQLSDHLLQAHENCRRIQDAVVETLRPGTPCDAPYQLALDMAESLGLKKVFMGPEDDQARFIAHGIGLEIDEFPILAPGVTDVLESGHVIALEPKAVIPETGAVGIENTWVIRDTGPRPVTHYPDQVREVTSFK
ncbi:MAG TPA: Xaa-Pro peptidase family protein [bacterium]|nr:Xaa-Pro peptidase family protein [bacterium]